EQLISQPEQETQLAHSLASTPVELHSEVLEPSSSSVDIHHQSHQNTSHYAQVNLALTQTSESDQILQQKVEEQEKTINKLQKEIMELRGLATIAESHLGRWRYKNFSH
ncbi:MAG: hypothetical protein SWJ54_21145, partial [Cyanobacteriota bacterium]|nr:hypothetical protein [Cyanobacteriota bacterium]